MGEVELKEKAKRLLDRADRISKGEELCDHHWNGSDGCYECYCTGCDKHIMEARDEESVPFKSEAYCYECAKTPEQKQLEKEELEKREMESELKTLNKLLLKYPEVIDQLRQQLEAAQAQVNCLEDAITERDKALAEVQRLQSIIKKVQEQKPCGKVVKWINQTTVLASGEGFDAMVGDCEVYAHPPIPADHSEDVRGMVEGFIGAMDFLETGVTIQCIGQDDETAEEKILGYLANHDGFWRWYHTGPIKLNCQQLKTIAAKVKQLNKSQSEVKPS